MHLSLEITQFFGLFVMGTLENSLVIHYINWFYTIGCLNDVHHCQVVTSLSHYTPYSQNLNQEVDPNFCSSWPKLHMSGQYLPSSTNYKAPQFKQRLKRC